MQSPLRRDKAVQIVLTHPGVGPFVQHTARAFAERGFLCRMVTTVVSRPDSAIQRLAGFLSKLFGYDLSRDFQRKTITEIPLNKVVTYPWSEVVRLLVSRFDKSGVTSDNIWEWSECKFDRWVSQNALHDASAVYGYEHACRETFRNAKLRGLKCIYEIPAPEAGLSRRIIQNELEKFPKLIDPLQRHLWDETRCQRRLDRRRSEWMDADLVVMNSTFTRSSFLGYENPAKPHQGLDKVTVIPLGSPPVDMRGRVGGTQESGPVRFLWTGTFSVRKGAHYLLDAWKRLNIDKPAARLDVYGSIQLSQCAMQNLPDTIKLYGSVPRDELVNAFIQSDVLVFPTLCDGFGMVVTEALSCGLPVITTRCAGASDLIRHGENGFVIDAADPIALASALEWCLYHRKELAEMRAQAIQSAKDWQWTDFRRALIESVLGHLIRNA